MTQHQCLTVICVVHFVLCVHFVNIFYDWQGNKSSKYKQIKVLKTVTGSTRHLVLWPIQVMQLFVVLHISRLWHLWMHYKHVLLDKSYHFTTIHDIVMLSYINGTLWNRANKNIKNIVCDKEIGCSEKMRRFPYSIFFTINTCDQCSVF